MPVVAEREERAHRDRLGREIRQRREVERLDHAVGPHALADAEAALERHDGRFVVAAEAVQVRAVLAPQV